MNARLADIRFSATVGFAACAFLLAGAAEAQSVEDGASALRISGFGTFGVVHADAPAGWKYRRDLTQAPVGGDTSASVDSRLGVQLNYAPAAQFELVGQLVATRRPGYAENTSPVQWAFAAYRPTENLTVRLGRLNVDAYLLSDYRNVGFAYPFVRPPVDFYGLLPTSLDGGDVTRTWKSGGASWRAKAYAGRSRIGDLSTGPAVDLKPLWGFVVSREADGLLLRGGLSQGRLASSLATVGPLLAGLDSVAALPVPAIAAQAAALRSQLDFARSRIRYAAIGASYEVGDWQMSAEHMQVVGRPVTSYSAHYLNVVRRFGPFSVIGGVSGVAHHVNGEVQAPVWGDALAPLVGAQVAQQTQALGSAAASALDAGARQRTLSVGARWDLHPQLALKAQWDHVVIDANGSALWAYATPAAGRANVFSLTVDFVY